MGITRKVANQLVAWWRQGAFWVPTLDVVNADINQSDNNTVETITLRLAIPVGIIRKVPNQLPGNPKCTLTPSLLMSSVQTPTKAIKISQRDNHTLLSDPNGNHPQGRKPVASEPKMHLDSITIDVVSPDTNQSDKNIAKRQSHFT